MAYKSGLSYKTLRAISDSGAIDSLSEGSAQIHGKKWRAVLTYQVPDSSKRSGYRQVFVRHTLEDTSATGRGKTSEARAKRMVAEWRRLVISDVRSLTGSAIDASSPVRICVETYIDERVALGKIRQSTATYYRNAAKRIYRYPLAGVPISTLTKPMVQAWVNDLAKTLSGKSVKASFDLLDAVCKKVLGYDHNPCRRGDGGIELPRLAHNSKKRGARPNALSYDGVARVNVLLDEREASYDGADQMALGARLALHTGMRAEEVCGLRWRDVDLQSKTLHVRRVIERAELPQTDEDGAPLRDRDGNIVTVYTEFESAPKTDKSLRDIPIDPETIEALRSHRRRTRAMIVDKFPEAEERPDINNLYVLGDIDGSFLSPYLLGKRWGKFSRTRGLVGTEGRAVTFHDLRHTAATRMLAAGIDVATVSHILGHAEVSVTLNRYTTSDERTKREAVDMMADVFSMRAPRGGDGITPFRTGTES